MQVKCIYISSTFKTSAICFLCLCLRWGIANHVSAWLALTAIFILNTGMNHQRVEGKYCISAKINKCDLPRLKEGGEKCPEGNCL